MLQITFNFKVTMAKTIKEFILQEENGQVFYEYDDGSNLFYKEGY